MADKGTNRRHITARVASNERRILSGVLDSTGALINVVDTRGCYVVWNRACEEVSGYSFEDVRGRRFDCVMDPAEAPAALASMAAVDFTRRQTWDVEYHWLTKAGQRRLIRWHSASLVNEDGVVDHFVSIGEDITERRRVENELGEQRRRLETLIANLPGMAYRCRNEIAWPMEFISQGSLEVTGYTPAEIIGGTPAFGDLIVESDRERVWNEVQAGVRVREPFRLSYSLRHRDGSLRHVWEQGRAVFDEEGRLLALEGFVIDETERLEALAALSESEGRYRAMFLENRAVKLLLDTSDGAIVDANPAAAEFYGWPLNVLKQKRVTDILVTSAEPGRGPHDERTEVRVRHRLASGELRDVEVQSSPIRLGRRELLFSIVHDVTQRRAAERALRESEQRNRSLIDAAFDVILIHEQGRILDVSESSERVLGRRREDLIGHHVLEFVPPDVVEDLKVKIATAFSRPYESKALRGDGQVLPIEVIGRDITYQGRVVRMTAVRDISARKRDEQRLIESEERFRLLSEATYEGIVVHENGLILDCNRSFARLVDSTVEACLGRNAFDFIEPASHELTRRNMIAGFEGAYLIGAVSASGRRFPAELQGRNLQGASSARRVVAVRDVTERERAEREIRALNEGLERRVAERTRELGAVIEELRSFAYSVSHDLRAPLRAIDGFARMLSDDHAQALDARGREHLARILSGTRRMAQLIDDLLKLSRVGRAEMNVDQVDLSALAREAVEEGLADRQPPGVRVEIEPGMSARGDASLLRVALTNLLENALKFSRRASEPMVRVGCERGGPEPVFFVSDNGAGFDMAYAGTLFKPFARLHASQEFEGTGIGLATVQRIIHRHGGRIWAEGAPGKGACFRFTLGAGHG